MAGRHRAPKQPTHLARHGLAVGIALSSAAVGTVWNATPTAAAPITVDPVSYDGSGEEASSPAEVSTYTVVAGDWLSKIAPRFGMTTNDLYLGNRGVVGDNPHRIFPGQVLTVFGSPSSDQHVQSGPQHAAAAFQSPLTGMRLTQAFKGKAHRGIDVGVPVGTPGYAVAEGTVRFSGPAQGFGLWTVITSQIDGQTVDFVYGHMDHLVVSVGDHVRPGDHVIDTGNNGVTTGAHLHFEVWIGGRVGGSSVDPMAWLRAHGVNV